VSEHGFGMWGPDGERRQFPHLENKFERITWIAQNEINWHKHFSIVHSEEQVATLGTGTGAVEIPSELVSDFVQSLCILAVRFVAAETWHVEAGKTLVTHYW